MKSFHHLMFSLLNTLFRDKTILPPNVLFHFNLLNYIWQRKILSPKPFFKKKNWLYMATKYFITETKFFNLFFSSAIFGDKIFRHQNHFLFYFLF